MAVRKTRSPYHFSVLGGCNCCQQGVQNRPKRPLGGCKTWFRGCNQVPRGVQIASRGGCNCIIKDHFSQTNKRDTRKGIPFICFALRAGGTRKIQSQYAGGILLQPVQKLVATLIFACLTEGQKCKRVPSGVPKRNGDTKRHPQFYFAIWAGELE